MGAAPAPDASVVNGRISVVLYSRPAAGYFELKNNSDLSLTLTGASTPACGSLMLHRSRDLQGTERMEMVHQVVVPAHGSIAFTPGDYHLMCLSPAKSLKPGGTAPVTLQFAGGGRLEAPFAVVGPLGR